MTIQFKRGDTLRITGIEVLDENGNATDLTAVDIKCQARTQAGDVAIDFTVTKDTATSYTLDAGDTRQCPVGLLRADIQYTDGAINGVGGTVSSTNTFTIICIKDQTYDN